MDATVEQQNNKRIAKNTLLLYFRMMLTMGVGLYTSRVILETLGVENFGIYSAVGGVVAMFSMISGALSSAISRFFTFELGKGNLENLRKVFSTAVIVQIFLSVIVILLAETAGVWFLNSKMNIPETSMFAANCVLQLSLLTFCVNLISVPYNAAIIAHERMKAFAYVSVLEALGKLGIAWAILVSPMDKLIFYALLMTFLSLIIRLVYGRYCKRNFRECSCKMRMDKVVVKQMFDFAGWNTIGQVAYVANTQGTNVLINLFFGVTMNAARGIAVQVDNVVNTFLNNFVLALNPQITKSYAVKNREYMFFLMEKGARLGFFLTLILVTPMILECDFLLNIWLKNVPSNAVLFTRLVLVYTLIQSLSQTLFTALLATGNIRNYQILVGGLLALALPLTYFLYKIGFDVEYCYYVLIVFAAVCLWIRLFLLRKMIGFSILFFIRRVVLSCLIVTTSLMFGVALLMHFFEGENSSSITRIVISIVLCVSLVFFFGLTRNEKRTVLSIKNKILHKGVEKNE